MLVKVLVGTCIPFRYSQRKHARSEIIPAPEAVLCQMNGPGIVAVVDAETGLVVASE